MSQENDDRRPKFAAVYMRVPAESQEYSQRDQMDMIREQAKRRGLEIVKVYSDRGESGPGAQGNAP
jgi:DNA invertase Pin-like site-specific DNA recombinase